MINFAVKLAVTAVMMGAQMALGAARKIEGPRLESTKVTTAEYGTPLDDFYGMRKLEGRPVIWADDLREEKKKTKTKGGKFAEYKYYGDWAVAIAGHQIDSVRRIWFDEHLVYQVGDVGPISVGGFAGALLTQASGRVLKLGVGRNLRIYLGTDTQQPDPLIEAWFEDHPDFGVNCTSAMRGTAYMVFQDIPLEKFGNRIPQVTVEAINGGTDAFPWEHVDAFGDTVNAFFSPDFSKLVFTGNTQCQIWDVPSRTLISTVNVGGAHVSVNNDGSFYTRPADAYIVSPGGGTTLIGHSVDLGFSSDIFGAGNNHWINGTINAIKLTGNPINPVSVVPMTNLEISYFFTDADDPDLAWVVGQGTAAPNSLGLACIDAIGVIVAHTILGTAGGGALGMDNGRGQILVSQGNQAYLIDKATGAVDLGPASTVSTFRSYFEGVQPGSPSIWTGLTEVSTIDLTVLKTYDPNSWIGAGAASNPIYDPINHAIWSHGIVESGVTIRFLDRVGSNGVTLETIVENEGSRVGCTIEASALNQLIPGWSVGPGPAKDRISPLLDLHDSIIRPHDFGIQGIKRGTSSVGTIDASDFVREGDEARYEIDIQQDGDLPQRLEVKYSALNNDQEVNNVIALRHTQAVDTSRVQQIDLSSYADTPDEMQQKADRFLRRIWNSKSTVKNGLTAQHLAAEPGDLYDLDLDGVTWTCELEKLTFTGGALKCEWRRTFPSLNALGQGTAPNMDGRPNDVIIIPSSTQGFVLDIPLIEDADNDINPLLYVAAGKYTSSWTGAIAWEGSDGSYDDSLATVTSSQAATWGSATTLLADANPNLWDRGNSITVSVFGGTLTSSTEAAINADPTINQIAIGANGRWEIVNFVTATLTGTNGMAKTYTLSGFLRGRRGTEMNVSNHTSGDAFVVLEQAQMAHLGADTVGDTLSFKVQTVGLDPDAMAPIDLAPYTGASLKPYAPAHLNWSTDGTDLFGEIIRRTRVGGAWTGGAAIPLSENSEAYEVDVLDGSGNVIDTITVTGTNTFTITAAELATYSASVSAPPDVSVYQMSDAVGRGFALAA